MVEMAIALPILLALLVGIFEFARAYNVKQVITNAAREGAREAVLPSATSTATVTNIVEDRLDDANITTATVTFNPNNIDVGTGTAVSVTVTLNYRFAFVGPVLDLMSPGSPDPGTITMSSTATMRKE